MCIVDTFVQVVDIQTGESLGPDTQGEICVKTPAVMLGYANNPKETAELIHSDGWVHTGNAMILFVFLICHIHQSKH